MENTNKKSDQTPTRNQIISITIWAAVILECYVSLDGSNKQIIYILASGFFIELVRISPSNKFTKKGNKQEI